MLTESMPSELIRRASLISTYGGPKRKLHNLLLEVVDVVISCAIVAPCVISYWRGTWELMGVLIFPNNIPLSALMSFLIGGLGHLVFTLTQSFFRNHIHPDNRRLTYYVISRLYTAIFGIVCVNMWRGSWILCDWLTSADSLPIIYAVTIVALLFLIATRTLRNCGAAPYLVAMDHKSNYFDVDTMFKIQGFHQPGLFILDTFFTVYVIGTLVVIAWRGLWGIMDFTLFPQDRETSSWGSLIMGYMVVLTTFIIRPLVNYISKKLDDGILKVSVCDVFYFMVFFGAVNVWRGIWNLLDFYIYPDDRILSYWITHVIPFFILSSLKCSNSILVRGVVIDAETDENGDSVTIPINYATLHFERERNKKRSNKASLSAADQHHNYQPTKHRQQSQDFTKSISGNKEAQSALIAKDSAKLPKIVSGLNAGQIV